MTRFSEKQYVFYDKELGDSLFCQVVRDLKNFRVMIKIAYLVDVRFDDSGNLLKIEQTDFQYICTLTSWQQYINRQFPGSRFTKVREVYIY